MSRGTVRAKAPGKINVHLGVGALQDDGYHDVATAYQAVSLYEFVEASEASDFSVRFSGPIPHRQLSTGADNLAIRAAMALARRGRVSGGVALSIEKHVPIAGGMGGGSADAAATLVACDELWGLHLGREALHEIARELGADVPFALAGGTAIGTGRGDQLSPALAKGQFHWVLAYAEAGLSTPDVYRALDEHRALHAADIAPAHDVPTVDARVLQALRAGDAGLLAEALQNDLQAPALRLMPRLAGTLELGERSGALAGIVSGSGPTVAFLCDGLESAIELQISLSTAKVLAVKVTGPVAGARLID
ncbi:4-(cytidine 5'-diphospho)-2-C-methyl-D-erythritol kinase [Agrococcus sp. Marseille-P2731]|uniref:4-(cytidine 5'-diphospho)-2-C-methyl-D-erythritol kinase n=1 Tax=Agrococcus sp. Marseille-P2731 TaxID=1841862 RepID=UPI000931CC5F|nr:4-(cytidine 5'-diphospho)-2-C-methyl-D-erythritol kinase [Agrococcus sp. Marseille-P2731]